MSVIRIANQTLGGGPQAGGLALRTRWTRPGSVSLTVAGEVDAANADHFLDRVRAALPELRRLVLDCSAVTFFAVEGFSSLQRVNVMCAQAGATWVLVPSEAVSRVIRLCNPGGSLVPVDDDDVTVTRLRTARPLRLVRD